MARRIWHDDMDEETGRHTYHTCRHRSGDPDCDCFPEEDEDSAPSEDEDDFDDFIAEEEDQPLLSELDM